MSSKKSKCSKQEQRIQQLEDEIADLKRDLQQQTRIVQFDEQQIEKYLNEIINKLDVSTNKICDEINQAVKSIKKPRSDDISFLLKLLVAALCFVIAIVFLCCIFSGFTLLGNGESGRAMLFILCSAGFCLAFTMLGWEIIKEKDRNYIVSLFSAVVALTALVVTIVASLKK